MCRPIGFSVPKKCFSEGGFRRSIGLLASELRAAPGFAARFVSGYVYSPTERDEATIEEICRRLDGMPLAIELAAARARAFPVAEIAARLDDRFRLLTGGSRQLERFALACLSVERLQVFQQNAPRHAVNHEVMHYQQQSRAAFAAFCLIAAHLITPETLISAW